MKQRLAILGSTGSIGVQTLDIVRENPDFFEVRVLTANSNWQRLAAQAREFDADTAVIADKRYYTRLRDALEETHAFPTYLVEMCGIGERTGNVPLEAMVFEYASLRGSLDGMDTTVITEIADYFKNEIGYNIPPMTPFVGSAFNVTRAGVHADGLMKDEEIYTIFDTKKILNKPATVQISKTSGLAGVAYWINQTYGLEDGEKLDKKSPLVIAMKEWVDQQYEDGRQTVMTERELKEKIRQLAPDFAERG